MARDSTPRDLHEKELTERLLDSVKQAISLAKEMHSLQPRVGWDLLATQLDAMLHLVKKLLKAKGQSRQKLLAGLDQVNFDIQKAQGR